MLPSNTVFPWIEVQDSMVAVNLLPLPACWSFWQELTIPAMVKRDKNDTTILFIFLAI